MKSQNNNPWNLIPKKYLRFFLIISAVLIVLSFEFFELLWPNMFNDRGWIAFHLLVTVLIAYAISTWVIRLVNTRDRSQHQVRELLDRLNRLQKHQQVVFEVSRNLVEAEDQNEMIEQMLHLVLDVTQAVGISYVPFDEREQPIASTSKGSLSPALVNPWAERLATRHQSETCKACEQLAAGNGENCALVDNVFQLEFPNIEKVNCFMLRCGERKVGMLNLYLSGSVDIDQETEDFLRAILDETALGLESIRLRKREFAAVQELQLVRKKTDLKSMVTNMVDHIQRSLDADFAVLSLVYPKHQESNLKLSRGSINPRLLSITEGMLHGVYLSQEPIIVSNVSSASVRFDSSSAIIAAPLSLPSGEVVGAVLVGNLKQSPYTRRQLDLLQTLASQLALLVRNTTQLSELEFKTMLEERNRLAREIHDGLAQTIGFLKLQIAQLQNYLDRGEYERVQKGLHTSYSTLSEAYLDVREAIDGLRINPTEGSLKGWLPSMLADFEEATQIQAEFLGGGVLDKFSPELQVQLIRIIQEALTNVRKHSSATEVQILCIDGTEEVTIEIRDNGHGFSPEEVATAAQYGLRGMRERAELIGADFQVISKPKEGTVISLRIFMPSKEKA